MTTVTGRIDVRHQCTMVNCSDRMAVPVSSVGDMTGVTVLGPTTGALTRINNTLRGGAAAHIRRILMTGQAVARRRGIRRMEVDTVLRASCRMTVATR